MALLVLDNKIIAKPNNSLDQEQKAKLLAVIALILLLVGLGFFRIGAWMVLPFAGLELVIFCYAFYSLYLHSNDFESITFDRDALHIEKKVKQQRYASSFSHYWARVYLRDAGSVKGMKAKSQLIISSHGKEVEFGSAFLTEAQREDLVKEIKQKIKMFS